MKERVRFAVGAASMVLAACCLMGALFTAWLRCAAGAVTQVAGWPRLHLHPHHVVRSQTL